jgi:hypothetical protein
METAENSISVGVGSNWPLVSIFRVQLHGIVALVLILHFVHIFVKEIGLDENEEKPCEERGVTARSFQNVSRSKRYLVLHVSVDLATVCQSKGIFCVAVGHGESDNLPR